MYLNEVPYGGSFYGVGAAAKGYFGKDPKDLNLVESAIMAGLPQNPSNYSPFIGRKDAWKGRAKDVLRRMKEDGYITNKEYTAALTGVDKYKFTSAKQSIDAPHFVFFVSRFVEKQFGAKALDQGLRIKTTLDLDSQRKLQDIVHDEVERLKDDYNLGNGAAVMLDSETGDILALVGSYDYNNNDYGKFDVATLGMRQPGSSLKPILYATAFEKKYTPATVLMDVETQFGVPENGQPAYKPVNYDGKFRGPVQMRFALANSLNIPAVKTLALIGLKDFLQKATDMGIESLNPTDENMKRFGLSAALGGGEVTLLDLTSSYSVFANGGQKAPLQFIEEIRDYNGKIIYRKPKANPKKVLSKEVSFLISHILSDDTARSEAFGRFSLLNIPGKTVAVKTGTTDSKRDNWAVGFTKDITLGVWVGNNNNSELNNKIASGTTGASSIWSKAMKEMLKTYKDGIIDKPENVNAIQIDAFLGGLPKDGNPTRSEYFIKGTEPTEVSPFYKKLKVHNGKIANEVQVKSGSFEEKDFYVFKEDDPVSGDGTNRWQEGIDKWAEKQTDDKYKWPHETSNESAEDLVVSISEPKNRTTIDTNDIKVKAKIISGGPKIKHVEININGERVKSWDEDRKEVDETFNRPDGVYKVQVVAVNEKDKKVESTMEIGVKKPWDDKGSQPAPTATTAPTAAP
jgi:membrane peptidoglycan carboxypeptidase